MDYMSMFIVSGPYEIIGQLKLINLNLSKNKK